MQASSTARVGATAHVTQRPVPRERVTSTAVLFAIAALLVAGSAFVQLRPVIGGLAVHPYVFGVIALLPPLVGYIDRTPRRVLFALLAFSGIVVLSTVPRGFSLPEMLKVGAVAATICAGPALLRTRRDIVVVVTCLGIAVSVIAIRGLIRGAAVGSLNSVEGVNVMSGLANKNAFSLYALPTLLLIGWVFTRMKTRLTARLILAFCALAIVVATFASANRSGWLGVMMVATMLAAGRMSARTMFLIWLGMGTVYLLASRADTREMIERRMAATREGNASDTMRLELIQTGFEIAWDNPFLGVSPQRVQRVMSRRFHSTEPDLATHNVYAHVAAASGFVAFGAMLYMLFAFAFPFGGRRHAPAEAMGKMMAALWLFRGMFTHEIMYSPTFAFGFGLTMALVQIERGEWLLQPRRRRARVAPSGNAGSNADVASHGAAGAEAPVTQRGMANA